MKFKCNSCRHVFEHEANQNECFCPKCGNTSTRCTEGKEEEHHAFCKECGTEIPAGSTSCPVCGCPASSKPRHCRECGVELTDSVHVCPQCGCPVSPAMPLPVAIFPPVTINQKAIPMEVDEQELSLPQRSKALYWYIGGIAAIMLVGFGLFYSATDFFKDKASASESVTQTPTQVVIDGTNLRMRYAPLPEAETYKRIDGSDCYPKKGERFTYKGETGDFYKIDYNGLELYVSKLHTHTE